MSARLLLNIAYTHLLAGRLHAEKCTGDRCVRGCAFREFDEWLDGPVTDADILADRRRRERGAALLRGEIPA